MPMRRTPNSRGPEPKDATRLETRGRDPAGLARLATPCEAANGDFLPFGPDRLPGSHAGDRGARFPVGARARPRVPILASFPVGRPRPDEWTIWQAPIRSRAPQPPAGSMGRAGPAPNRTP